MSIWSRSAIILKDASTLRLRLVPFCVATVLIGSMMGCGPSSGDPEYEIIETEGKIGLDFEALYITVESNDASDESVCAIGTDAASIAEDEGYDYAYLEVMVDGELVGKAVAGASEHGKKMARRIDSEGGFRCADPNVQVYAGTFQ